MQIKGLFLFCVTILFSCLFVSQVQAFVVGDKVSVQWKGKWWPATVLSLADEKACIHYDGYSNAWDECVGPDRIQSVSSGAVHTVGQAVSVEWKGKWWPAKVLQAEKDRWLIHYDGYSSSWDEWVTTARIRSQ